MSYDMIDRFLRNNLGDDDYAEYSSALDLLCTPPQRKPPQFPTMLRKMWSGAEVQKWINENWEEA